MTGRGQTEHITLTRSAFASMLNSVLYPNPDDSGNPSNPFGPFGPGGPVMQRWLWAALNPQPLPPGPDPYRAAFAARVIISRAAAQYDMAEVLGDEQSERSIIIVGGKVSEIVDEWCGTPVPGHHGPGPHFIGLLAAGVQFQKAADTMRNSPLRSVFADAAGKLFKTGLAQMESHSDRQFT